MQKTQSKEPEFLRAHIAKIMGFYYPVCMDHEYGGYINQLRDNGTIFDRMTKHLVGTCRFVYNFSLSSMVLGNKEYHEAAAHGVRFLADVHRQDDGGFAWVLSGREVEDGTRYCYGHAFVLLAAAGAVKAGVSGAPELLGEVWDLLEKRFWEPSARLYVDEIGAGDWSAVNPYRGQNANMHMCEAMLAAFEATGERRYLERATLLAQRICVDLSAQTNGKVWEHYRSDWSHDWEYNKDDPHHLFKPYGYLPGHFTEWAKLLLILNRHSPSAWQLARAESLFETALANSWDNSLGGINYSFDPGGKILDTDRYYWVFAETFAAAAMLALKTGEDEYWNWYERVWEYANMYFVDHEYGGWYRLLDNAGVRYSDEKSPASKTDYHPLAACYEVLEQLRLDNSVIT